ncbi:hypothetical protein [Vibrio cidicii]|uniref:hypothetical protein n=1 Tax=Vibrio cidicii TaxID=1763883 RepID=UPI0018C2306C|nr:hypothetical protein [Vibrio cidicii]MBG0757609.1 hypothetical protein [Vibrio cidicii]
MRIGILFLVSLSALFTSFSHASTCPIGKRYDRVEFPLGTPIVYSVCIDGCRGEQKFNDLDTWTCTDNLGKCVALYTLTGQSCTGQDDTDGSCDSNGQNCTTEPDTGNPDPDPDPDNPNQVIIPKFKGSNPDEAAIFVAHHFPELNHLFRDVLGIKQGFSGLKNTLDKSALEVNKAAANINTNNVQVLSGINDIKSIQHQHFNNLVGRIGEVRNNTNDIKEQISSIDNKIDALDSSDTNLEMTNSILSVIHDAQLQTSREIITNRETMYSLRNSIYDVRNSIYDVRNVGYEIRNNLYELRNTNSKLDSILGELQSGGDGDGSGGDNSEVVGAIDSVGTKIDGLGDSLEGMGDKLGGLSDKLDGKGLSKGEHGSLINFGETPLYQESEVEKLAQEVEDLKEQYTEKVNDFKKLFSLNLDSLSSGEYREHFLDFEFANGAKLRAGSSVFPALIDNSGLIASVILFIAVIAGLRVVMGAKD